MKKEVLVRFSGANSYENDNQDQVEFLTTGNLYKKNNKYYLKYQEQYQEFSKGEVQTVLKIEENKVTIIRTGAANTQMILEKGKTHTSHYETEEGSYTIGVLSDDVFIDMNEEKGRLILHYDVMLNNLLASKNQIQLTFEEVLKTNE